MRFRIVASLGALAVLSGCILYAPVDLGALGSPGKLQETVALGSAGAKLALIEVSGVIAESDSRTRIGISERPGLIVETRNALDRAAADEDVVGILLRINSPGGSVSASDTLHHEIESWKSEHKHPVVAYLNGNLELSAELVSGRAHGGVHFGPRGQAHDLERPRRWQLAADAVAPRCPANGG